MNDDPESRPPSQVPQFVATHFIRTAFPGSQAIRALSREEAQLVASKLQPSARGAPEVDKVMRSRGLLPGMPRAAAYSAFSRTLGAPKNVVVIPYSPADPKSNLVGGVGISEGEPAIGVIVEMRGNRVASFTSFEPMGDKLVENAVSTDELIAAGPDQFVDRSLERGSLDRHLTADVAVNIADDAFRALLFDQHSTMIHSPNDLRELAFNAPLIAQMAELQYKRVEGVAFSPDVSCCCCCCCCWGSCSSCSATATKYVNQFYQPRATE